MKKREQIALVRSATETLTELKNKLEAAISNPTVLRQYDIISGKIDAYDAALQLLEGNGISIRIDCC